MKDETNRSFLTFTLSNGVLYFISHDKHKVTVENNRFYFSKKKQSFLIKKTKKNYRYRTYLQKKKQGLTNLYDRQ